MAIEDSHHLVLNCIVADAQAVPLKQAQRDVWQEPVEKVVVLVTSLLHQCTHVPKPENAIGIYGVVPQFYSKGLAPASSHQIAAASLLQAEE